MIQSEKVEFDKEPEAGEETVSGLRGFWQQWSEMDRRWLGWLIMVALIVAGTLLGVQFPALPPMPEQLPSPAAFEIQAAGDQYTNFSGLVIGAPTTFATATPGTILNTDGLGKILELQDAGTPVASFADGGAVDFDSTLNVDGAVVMGTSLEINGNITLENDETISNSLDKYITITVPADGYVDIATGNLSVGDGSPDGTMDGEDAYVEGIFEVDGAVRLDAAVVMNSTLEVNGNITLENDETIVNSLDKYITITVPADGYVDIATGNLSVGDGSPDGTMDGEDAYVEGIFEVDGAVRLDAAVVMNSTLEVNGNITLENDETIVNSLDKYITITVPADGYVDIATGNLSVGDGSPDGTMDGEDVYVEGIFEVDGAVRLDGAVVMNSTLEVNGNITLEYDETISNSLDKYITITVPADGFVDISTGNLSVGDGVPDGTMDGEDGYIEGIFEVDGAVRFDSTLEVNASITMQNDEVIGNATDTVIDISGFLAFAEAAVVVVTEGSTITALGTYQPITSTSPVTTGTGTAIANGVKNGQLLVLVNENASDAIIIDDGANTKLGGDKTLTGGEGDGIWLIWDGADWLCIGYNDN